MAVCKLVSTTENGHKNFKKKTESAVNENFYFSPSSCQVNDSKDVLRFAIKTVRSYRLKKWAFLKAKLFFMLQQGKLSHHLDF